MSTSTVPLDDVFARTLPELAVPWQSEAAPAPDLVVLDEELAAELGLGPEHLRSPAGVRTLLGLELPPGARPVAQGYAGHQFGGYSPRLGDGRALLLGELRDPAGRLRDLHLKGSGRTPWARGGDGLAGLGPMLREYVVSQAMHALGIPTTRSLAVLTTGRLIARETAQPGAVLARVAASHLRVGSFQYARALGEEDLLRRLVEHALERHYPDAEPGDSPALTLFDRVVTAQAELVAQWMLVGFVHGVMNTDNMTVSGETIDYGPCAFLDAYDPGTVFSSIDDGGRYAFGNQPAAAQWNLARFAEALLPLIHPEQEQAIALAVPVLEEFGERYTFAWARGMHGKLGLVADAAAEDLAEELLELMAKDRVDFTQCFRGLSSAARGDAEPVRSLFLDLAGIDGWLERWRGRAPDAVLAERCNPVYIPRNHLVEEALDAAVGGDLTPVRQLLTVLREPFAERDGQQRYAEPAPDSFGRYTTFCGT